MNADDLEKLVLSTADGLELARAFEGMDEKERAKLSASAQNLHRHLDEGKATSTTSEQLNSFLSTRGKETGLFGEVRSHWNNPENRKAALAVFAVGPLSAAKKWQVRPRHNDMPAFEKIIRDRMPDWIDAWVAHELDQQSASIAFPTLHKWVQDGICRKPKSDGYYRLFAGYLMRTGFYGGTRFHGVDEAYIPPLSEQLLQAPELLSDIDGLFRVETEAFNTNAWLTKGAAAHYETWPEALIKLSRAKHLDRSHLLRLALDGLRLDIKQNQLSGYHKLYRAMEPTASELIDHQPDYIGLLCHPVSHVAKFALDMLTKIEKAKALQRDPFLREIGSVFANDSKSNAIAALKLLQRIVGETSQTAEPVVIAAIVDALRHADPEVQAKGIEILEPYAPQLSSAHRAAIADMVVLVSASNRPALEKLLMGASHDADSRPKQLESALPIQPVGYLPLSFTGSCQEVLAASAAIEPITSVDKLIDSVFHAIEVVDSPDELERIIDALSRLADQRPEDFEKRVAPLLHRLNKGQVGSNGLGSVQNKIAGAVLDLVISWASGQLHQTQVQSLEYSIPEDVFVPMIWHLREISSRVAAHKAQPLLAAPTHQGGWIDPIVWVERLAKLAQDPSLVRCMDLRLSMLRLAPDNRPEALRLAETLGGEIGRLARFALGGRETPVKSDQTNYALWITAARCREPDADWSGVFACLALDDIWPDSLSPAIHEWTSSHRAVHSEQMSWKHAELKVQARTADRIDETEKRGLLAPALDALGGRTTTHWEELPTAALCRWPETKHNWSTDINSTWHVQWLAYIWPQKLDSVHMKAVKKLVLRIEEDSSNSTPNHGLLSSLFQKGRLWGEPGHLVLALSIIGKDSDVRTLAIDALIEGVESRLFDPDTFASVMVRLCEGEWVKYNRLAENLLKVAKVSELHAGALDAALQAWLPHFDLAQRNAHYVLQVLVETQAISGAPILASTREILTSLKGKNKGTALAKLILA
jgi:hypothetical protein